MSYLPSIRPSIVQKRQLLAENRLSRAEVARRREEALYLKFKFITKQSKIYTGLLEKLIACAKLENN